MSKGSSERAHGTKKAGKDKNIRALSAGRTGGAGCNSTVLDIDWYVHYWQLGLAGVARCTDTLVTGQVQREKLRRTSLGFGLEIIITRATPPAHRAQTVFSSFSIASHSVSGSVRGLPRAPTNAYTVVIGSEAEQRRFNAG